MCVYIYTLRRKKKNSRVRFAWTEFDMLLIPPSSLGSGGGEDSDLRPIHSLAGFMAGSLAGVCEVLVGHPLDTVRWSRRKQKEEK